MATLPQPPRGEQYNQSQCLSCVSFGLCTVHVSVLPTVRRVVFYRRGKCLTPELCPVVGCVGKWLFAGLRHVSPASSQVVEAEQKGGQA